MFFIETGRLRLRPLAVDDLDALHEILGDAETMQFYPAPYDREGTLRWIHRSRRSYDDFGYGLWAVVLKDSGELIGQCGILNVSIDGEEVPEIAYHIHRSFWNQGYATEAARACLNFGFGDLGLKTLYIHTSLQNVPSQRVAEKIGMQAVKEFDKFLPALGETWRHIVYSSQNLG
jgi:RimJ/RimL family protein N-acetyltransferase